MENIVRLVQEFDFNLEKCCTMSATDIGFPDILDDLPKSRRRICDVLKALFKSGYRCTSNESSIHQNVHGKKVFLTFFNIPEIMS